MTPENTIDTQSHEDEISLLDIYDFFVTNIKTIFIWVLIAIGAGAAVAFSLPVKYEASALIEPSRIASTVVESKEILVEKLKSPTYYSNETIKACGFDDEDVNPQSALAKSLNASIPRTSNFVAVSYKSSSPALAKVCLEAVLSNIINNQSVLAAPLIDRNEVALRASTKQFEAAKNEQEQLLTYNHERLAVARTKLAGNQAFVDQFSKDVLSFKFDNNQFSAWALLLNTLISKQNDIKQLELEINLLQFEVNGNITTKDNEVLELGKQLNDLKNAMNEPLTRKASFATPIYAPDQKVEPKRSIILLVSVFAGFALSVMFLLGRKALRHVQAQRLAKPAS